MDFYGLLDFYPRKEEIKEKFETMNNSEKSLYKMYVYSLPFMEEGLKDLIWEYINGFEESIFDLAKQYRVLKTKVEKRKKIESQNNVKVGELERDYWAEQSQ